LEKFDEEVGNLGHNILPPNEFLAELNSGLMRGNRPSLISETQGHIPYGWWDRNIFLKIFFKWASCLKNSGGFTGRQNFTVPISEGREMRGHLQLA